MTDLPSAFIKRHHKQDCNGDLHRVPGTVHIDRTGRVGNGGWIAHEYVCNRSWAGCKARVLVPEQAVRRLAVAAEEGAQ